MKQIVRRIRFKQRIFLYLFITMTIPVILLGTFSFRTYMNALTEEVNSSVEASLEQFKLRMDTTVNYIKKYYIEASDSDEVSWLINNDIKNSDYSKLVEAQKLLSCSAYLSDYISGYTFINRATGKVLSNRGMYAYDLVTNKVQVEAFEGKGSGWMNNTSLEGGIELRREAVDLSGILFYQNLPLTQKDKTGLMLVNIDVEKVNESVHLKSESSEVLIYDKNGILVYASDTDIAKVVRDRIQAIENGDYTNLTIEDKGSYMIGTVDSDIVEWTYVVAWNLNTAQTGAGSILTMTVVIIIGGAVLLGLIWLFASRLYKPVASLLNYASDAVSDEAESDDYLTGSESNEIEDDSYDAFSRITGNIDRLVDKNTELKVELKAQESQLSEFFLTRLISGNLKQEQIEFYLMKLKIKVYDRYSVMTIGLNNFSGDKYNEARQDALRLEVAEHIPTDIKNMFVMEPACDAKVITIVLGADDFKVLDDKIIEVYKGFDIYVQMTYHFPVKVGVSTPFSDLRSFKKAHNEAIEALKNNEAVHGSNESSDFEGVTFYSDIQSRENGNHHYDRLQEKEVREAVDDGDMERAFKLVSEYIDQLMAHNVAVVERQFYIQRLMNEIFLVPIEAGINVDQIFGEGMGNVYQTMNQIYDRDKLKQFYQYSIIEPITTYLKEHRASKSSQIIKEIIELVENTEGNITLSECADQLGYHSTYIWKVMKVERNITFSEYIADYKIEQAKSLLIETDMTVNEIASKQGYTNAQNFIRFFNKHVGITPGKYRKKI